MLTKFIRCKVLQCCIANDNDYYLDVHVFRALVEKASTDVPLKMRTLTVSLNFPSNNQFTKFYFFSPFFMLINKPLLFLQWFILDLEFLAWQMLAPIPMAANSSFVLSRYVAFWFDLLSFNLNIVL